MRLAVMRMATVERLQLLWGLLALFGSMSWMSLMPAYAFWNRVDPVHFKAPVYSFFLVATVSTSLSAIWQSLCPFLTRQSQRALLPRIINHPATQTATIFISVVLTILNFFSWMVLAGNKDYGAKTSCLTGTFAKETGYAAQCRGVNVAIIFDVVVFFLWIPISVVIVCGTIDRGLWWWGEDDGWAQGETIVGGTNMMSEEEFDMKIGMGGKQIKRRQTVHPESMQQQQVIQQPKPAFVTPIASQFRSSSALDDNQDDGEEDDFTNFTPSSYRRHHQQRQQQQQRRTEPRQLNRRGSNTSLSSRLSTFFGAGWNNGTMPPEDQPPMPQMPLQYRQESAAGSRQDVYNSNNNNQKKQTPQQQQQQRQQPSSRKTEESKQEVEEESDPADMHGDSYASQWHSRRYDDWS
ncbi:hypothetical protein BGZ58_004590 [Dissophora ornata]|nr:hypothetical protein BGZ58_004590 [Dissophora ornata]